MTSPTPWSTPGSVSSVGASTLNHKISYANGYWFSLVVDYSASPAAYRLRWATDPSGTWTEATLPAPPTGYSVADNGFLHDVEVISDGTTFAVLVGYYKLSPTTYRHRILYATNPAGTWSSYQFDATESYEAHDLAYGAGTWVLVGTYRGSTPQPAFVATSSTVNGTYTFLTTSAATGYSTSGLPSFAACKILGIDYDGSTWVTVGATQNTSNTYTILYSSSPTSGWAAPSSIPSGGFIYNVRYHANGWWTAEAGTDVFYTNSPSGTWSQLASSSHGATYLLSNISHNGDSWVVVGAVKPSTYSIPAITYLDSTGSPSGTYTVATDTFTLPGAASSQALDIGSSGTTFVVGGSYLGQIRYWPLVANTTRKILRLRQSPRSNPTRVGQNPTLRARQKFV